MPLDVTTPYDEARSIIRNGDILTLRRAGIIPWGTLGGALHVMVAAWRDDTDSGEQTLGLVEAREGKGIQWVTLHSQVKRFPGLIDVHRPLCPRPIAERAATIAMRQCGKRYDYFGLWRAAALRSPLIHFLSRYEPLDPDDLPKWDDDKFCSYLADWVYCRAIYGLDARTIWRPVRNVNARDVVPVQFEQSGSFFCKARGLLP